MKNLPILIVIALFLSMWFVATQIEMFSSSGLSMSNRYCNRLTDIYFRPDVADAELRESAHNRICGCGRRNSIDREVGNYYTVDGVLI
jgi:hypothetical protein